MGKYGRFDLMIACSTLVMYGLMYLNTYAPEHVHFSQPRAGIVDPLVRKLADTINATQRREIAEMEALIADIEAHGPRR